MSQGASALVFADARTEYLAFMLVGGLYAMDILKVQEIRGSETLSGLAIAP
jgi:chemotaxis signal transduction protein